MDWRFDKDRQKHAVVNDATRDILSSKQATRDIAAALYYTGIDRRTRQRFFSSNSRNSHFCHCLLASNDLQKIKVVNQSVSGHPGEH